MNAAVRSRVLIANRTRSTLMLCLAHIEIEAKRIMVYICTWHMVKTKIFGTFDTQQNTNINKIIWGW